MKIEKINEEIERVDNYGGFLLIRTLTPSDKILSVSDEHLIENIILSKYHHWRGEEEPNGLTVGMSSSDNNGKSKSWTLTNHKFYGFFDNNKIKPEHYKLISLETFSDKLFKAIKEHAEYDNLFIDKATDIIKGQFNDLSIFYFLDLDKENNSDMVAEMQVYEFFYVFIALDRQKNIVTLIEFGLD